MGSLTFDPEPHVRHHRAAEDLAAAMPRILAAPADVGTLSLIVRRPGEDQREILDEGALDLAVGLAGDTWDQRPSSRSDDGGPHPDMQLNVMGTRVLEALAGEDRERWALAGDQLIVDLDLSPENLPVGTLLAIGEEAVIAVTDQPHRGCPKFAGRFGVDALRFVNTGVGGERRFRGLNAKVVVPGTIRAGDAVRKVVPTG